MLAFFLDLHALIEGFHGPEHAAALRQTRKLLIDRLFDAIAQPCSQL